MLFLGLLASLALAAKPGGELYPYASDEWGKMDEVCMKGKSQSPIDLPPTAMEQNERIILMKNSPAARSRKVELKAYGGRSTGGHGLGFVLPKGFQMETPETRRTYDLLQFHAHTGSEHFVDGKQYALEFHYVHSRTAQPISVGSDGDLAVIGVLFDVWDGKGKKPKSIKYIGKLLKAMKCTRDDDCAWSGREDKKTPSSIRFDPTIFLKLAAAQAQHRYWTYSGGLTTPNCAEIVSWHVYMKPLYLTQRQLELVNALQGHDGNFRPPKPLNGRSIAPLDWRQSWFNGPRTMADCHRAKDSETCRARGDTCSWNGFDCIHCRSHFGQRACMIASVCSWCASENACLPAHSERMCACATDKETCQSLDFCAYSRGRTNSEIVECHLRDRN